uniref:DNA-directed DNA polymerase n=1 Tax=Tetranychus urticae TaxID=32264 RepID=A0A158P4E4_TETUR
MMQKLPYDRFTWCDVNDADFIEKVLHTDDSANEGYFLEVDLEYPPHLHELHNDYPLAPEKMKIGKDMLSPYQCDLIEKIENQQLKYISQAKLITSFIKKENYVIHYKSLKFYVAKGLKITKIHRAIKFRQLPWLAPYVDFCTQQRKMAKNPAQSNFWKLNVNALYGKTIENTRNHLQVMVAENEPQANFQLRKELCERFIILNEDLALIQVARSKVRMDKPISVGFTILELAKLKMYELHYDAFKESFGEKIELLYTDTDSLIYHLQTDNLNQDLKKVNSVMDFSNYPQQHQLYSNVNEKKIGFLKDEMAGEPIYEFVGIKAKLYAFKSAKGESKRAKGVQRCVLEREISFKDYIDCIYNERIQRKNVKRLASHEHNISLISQTKVSLSPFDDKRYLLDDKITSFAFGHYKINEDM